MSPWHPCFYGALLNILLWLLVNLHALPSSIQRQFKWWERGFDGMSLRMTQRWIYMLQYWQLCCEPASRQGYPNKTISSWSAYACVALMCKNRRLYINEPDSQSYFHHLVCRTQLQAGVYLQHTSTVVLPLIISLLPIVIFLSTQAWSNLFLYLHSYLTG